MSGITQEALIRFFEKAQSVRFVDASTGRLILELLEEGKTKKQGRKSDYELWLAEQDEETQLAHRMGAI
jgi:hypothetical protein